MQRTNTKMLRIFVLKLPFVLYAFCFILLIYLFTTSNSSHSFLYLKTAVLLPGIFPFSLSESTQSLCSCQPTLNTAIQLSLSTGLLSQGTELDFQA